MGESSVGLADRQRLVRQTKLKPARHVIHTSLKPSLCAVGCHRQRSHKRWKKAMFPGILIAFETTNNSLLKIFISCWGQRLNLRRMQKVKLWRSYNFCPPSLIHNAIPPTCTLQSFFNRRGQTAPKTILFQAEFGKFVGEQKYNSTIFLARRCIQICSAIKGFKPCCCKLALHSFSKSSVANHSQKPLLLIILPANPPSQNPLLLIILKILCC